MQKKITSEVLIAYSLCPRKAFLLLCSNEKGSVPEYSQVLRLKKEASQQSYINSLEQQALNAQSYNIHNLKDGWSYLTSATINVENLEASCGVLTKTNVSSSLGRFSYELMIFTGRQSIEKEDKLTLMFVGYLLGQIQKKIPGRGAVATIDKRVHTIKFRQKR